MLAITLPIVAMTAIGLLPSLPQQHTTPDTTCVMEEYDDPGIENTSNPRFYFNRPNDPVILRYPLYSPHKGCTQAALGRVAFSVAWKGL